MIDYDAIAWIADPAFHGTVRVEATDEDARIRVRLGPRGEVTAIEVVALTQTLKTVAGLRAAVREAANRAETQRVLQEMAAAGVLQQISTADVDRPLPPLAGPRAGRPVVRTFREQADAFARYENSGALRERHTVAGATWRTSGHGYLQLAFDEHGRVQDVRADPQWLEAVNDERLGNALREAVN